MIVVSLDGQSIFGLVWIFKWLPSKHRESTYDNLGHLPVYFRDHYVAT